MKLVGRLMAVAALLIAGLATGPAIAQAAENTESGSEARSGCKTWIDGEWGHGSCVNTTGVYKTMVLHVECDAWWDSNVDQELEVAPYSTVESQGHCYSSVDWVTARIN